MTGSLLPLPDDPRPSDLLPGDGRRIGHWLESLGIQVELLGIWLQKQAAEITYRRARAWRRWGK